MLEEVPAIARTLILLALLLGIIIYAAVSIKPDMVGGWTAAIANLFKGILGFSRI